MAEPDELDEELERPPPPGPVDVARQALILSAVVCRSNLECYSDEEYRQDAAEDVQEWLGELGLWPYLEAEEERIIRAPFGGLPHHLGVGGTWYVEGLAILTWALHRG